MGYADPEYSLSSARIVGMRVVRLEEVKELRC